MEDIFNFISEDSKKIAKKVVKEIFEKVQVLQMFPKLGYKYYEDDENLFVWEGRPDLVALLDAGLIVCDHKTQGQTKSIYQFNNQSRGYCWAVDTTKFAYNYIVFTKYPSFRREVHLFSQAQLEDWKSTTIEWFFRIKAAKLAGKFLQSWNCSTIYGPCEFHRICEQPKSEIKAFTIKSQFKPCQVYRSW